MSQLNIQKLSFSIPTVGRRRPPSTHRRCLPSTFPEFFATFAREFPVCARMLVKRGTGIEDVASPRFTLVLLTFAYLAPLRETLPPGLRRMMGKAGYRHRRRCQSPFYSCSSYLCVLGAFARDSLFFPKPFTIHNSPSTHRRCFPFTIHYSPSTHRRCFPSTIHAPKVLPIHGFAAEQRNERPS